MSNQISEQKETDIDPFQDIDATAQFLGMEIALLLKEEVEELNVFSHIFRSTLERCLKRVLWAAKKNNQPIAIYPETVPGFTLMVFKRMNQDAEEIDENFDDKEEKQANNPFKERENVVLKSVMNRFFEKNQQKVMSIEFPNAIFALFPITDTRDNLKRMEMYFVE